MRRSLDFLVKMLLALAPVGWGLLFWFLSWGPAACFMPPFPLSTAIKITLGFCFFIFCFKNMYQEAVYKYQPTFFGYSFSIPPWWALIVVAYGTLFASLFFMPLCDFPLIGSLITGILVIPSIEEFVGHTVFVTYRLSGFSAVGWSFVSALAWMLMHRWYECPLVPVSVLISRRYFEFGFLMALIAWKTRRIEITILLHMFSNFLRYTFPVLILHQSLETIPFYYDVISCLFLACLVGLGYKERDK